MAGRMAWRGADVDAIEAQERSRPRALHARGVEGKLLGLRVVTVAVIRRRVARGLPHVRQD
jgi:hypothetical protein